MVTPGFHEKQGFPCKWPDIPEISSLQFITPVARQIPALHVCRPSRSLALADHFSLPDYINFLREARGRSHLGRQLNTSVQISSLRWGGSSFSFVLNAITSVIQLYRDKKLGDSGYKEKEHEKPLRTLVRLVSDICKVYGAEREEGRVEPESGSGQRNFDGLTLWRERLLCSSPWKGTTISLPKSTKHIRNIQRIVVVVGLFFLWRVLKKKNNILVNSVWSKLITLWSFALWTDKIRLDWQGSGHGGTSSQRVFRLNSPSNPWATPWVRLELWLLKPVAKR